MEIFTLVGKMVIDGQAKAEKDLNRLEGFVKRNEKAFKRMGKAMTIAGTAIVGGMALALKAAADFETAMREVNTMMGLSQEEFAGFSKEVQTLAADLGVDAVEAAKALYQAISAGVPRENVLDFLTIATKAAIGGVTDTETAVDGLSTVLNAFKLPLSETQKIADIMFTTVKGGKTTFEELSASLFQVAPIAAASKISFEEVSAALSTMTKQGVPTKVAVTQLRQAMIALQKPTVDMNKVIKSLGFESGQTMVAEIGLAESLNRLRDATAGNNEQLMKMFGSVEAGGAVLALTGDNAVMFAADLEAMANAAGSASAAFLEMEKSASRQLSHIKANFKDFSITIGTILLPILSKVLAHVKPILDSIKEWTRDNEGLTKTIVLITGAAGLLMLGLGPILMMLPQLIKGITMVGIAFKGATGWIGLILSAIAFLVIAWQTDMGGIREVTERVVEAVIHAFGWLWDKIMMVVEKITGSIAWMMYKFAEFVNVFNHDWAVSIWKSANKMVEAVKGFSDKSVSALEDFDVSFAKTTKAAEEGAESMSDSVLDYADVAEESFNRTAVAAEEATEATKKLREEQEKLRMAAGLGQTTLTKAGRKAFFKLANRLIAEGEIEPEDIVFTAPGRGGAVPLAGGGIVMSPTLATIAEKQPEAVIPLDQLKEMLGGVGERHYHINLVDGRELAEIVIGPLGDKILQRQEMEGSS